MYNKDFVLALEIKNKILSHFVQADVDIFYDKEQDEYFISIRDKELYNSEEYGKLVFEINENILWGQGIFNFYFILDTRDCGFEKTTKEISFSLQDEIQYTSWIVNNTHSLFVDKHFDLNDSSLAA